MWNVNSTTSFYTIISYTIIRESFFEQNWRKFFFYFTFVTSFFVILLSLEQMKFKIFILPTNLWIWLFPLYPLMCVDVCIEFRFVYQKAVSLEKYGSLLKQWEKREASGEKMLSVATALLASLPSSRFSPSSKPFYATPFFLIVT